MTDHPIVFLDTETTGLHADRRPWEIAWIRREPDGTETEHLIQILDVDLTTAELKGLQVGRFHDRYHRHRPGPVDDSIALMLERVAATEVEKATRGAIIVGAVPNFDTETLAAMLRRHQLCPTWHYQLVDIETLAAGWLRAMPDHAPIVQKHNTALASLTELELRQSHTYRDIRKNPDDRIVVDSQLADAREHMAAVTAEGVALLTPPWRSDDLSRACGVEPPTPEERHTALGDARWVKRWYDFITTGDAA